MSMTSACLTIQPEPTQTLTPAPVSPSPTVEFPTLQPTSTSTPEPSPTPTPDILSGLGPVRYYDRFTILREWEIPDSEVGGAGLINDRFSISVRKPNASFMTVKPEPIVGNFYIEAVVRSELCSDDDEFGLIFRTDPDGGHYRFTLTCNGEARVSRTFGGSEVVLVPKTPTIALIPGLLVDNRIGVLANGKNLRFFINGIEVFTIDDRTVAEGRFGFFVRSRSDGQTTASFDDLLVREISPTPTPVPSPTKSG
jgi:hypothetical protein